MSVEFRDTATDHANGVLLGLGRDPDARPRDVANRVRVTGRACQGIVAELEASGYLRKERIGRRNRYTINPARPFRHPAEADYNIGGLISLFETD